jgi:hypothetical protein
MTKYDQLVEAKNFGQCVLVLVKKCDNNNNRQLVSLNTTLYYIVQSGWWRETTIGSTPHQINMPPTSYAKKKLFLLFF